MDNMTIPTSEVVNMLGTMRANIVNDNIGIIFETPEEEKHLKGYIYDSLMYRYMRAREAMAELESIRFKLDRDATRKTALRDMLRFSEILNEVIGEHD